MKYTKRSLSVLILPLLIIASSNVVAGCREAVVPAIPNPDIASEYEMQLARMAVDEYLAEQEMYLNCVRNDRLHNQAVERMHDIANQYNRSARKFKARMQSMDMYTELVLLDFTR